MKDYRLTLFVNMSLLTLAICFFTEAYGSNRQVEKGMKVYYNGFTYIEVDSGYCNAKIYNMDCDSFHPVIPQIIMRGNFQLQHLKDDFYSIVNRELPGIKCIDHMDVSHTPNDTEYIQVKFRLGCSKERYQIMAKRIQTNIVYTLAYPSEDVLLLPKDKLGYRFSIIPESISEPSLAGITYGFSPTLKYLNLQEIQNNVFSSGGIVEISLPLFEDGIFDLWCIDGDMMQIKNQILNDKIIWHGKEFTLFKRIPEIFNF